MNKKTIGLAVVLIAAAFLMGRGCAPEAKHGAASDESAAAAIKFWTCSMHPQIQQPGPGQCPLCGMDLIPVYEGQQESLGEHELKLSDVARKLASIETVPVERRFADARIRMVGKVEYDETRLGYIAAWMPGRLDRLYVDYTGVPVQKNDHMVSLYSPDLMAAQEELIQTLVTTQQIQESDSAVMKKRARETVESAREKLRLLGLTDEQVREIERSGKPAEQVTIYAPMSGIVIEKHAMEGMYVETGTRIYTIADLSTVWVKLDAYESDLTWIRYGQDVSFTTEAYPGEIIHGTVAFIDPVLNEKTRTIKVRVNVPNPDGKLKPGMFVRGEVFARMADGGQVIPPDLAGQWICPMHPEILKEEQGTCDLCGMDLVSVEAYGYVQVEAAQPPLMIPAQAPLITGRRALVYVEQPGEEGIFEGREVVLGPRAGNAYVVISGLEEGERVVVQGNFKIDSALQILAKSSMMSQDADTDPHAHHDHDPAMHHEAPPAFQDQLAAFFEGYEAIGTAMAADDDAALAAALETARERLAAVDMGLLEGDAHDDWMPHQVSLRNALRDMVGADTEKTRELYEQMSDNLLQVVEMYGIPSSLSVYVMECPMAFDNKGAQWLQAVPELHNPYFSGGMLSCGSVVKEIHHSEED